jgi:hypothetical protein
MALCHEIVDRHYARGYRSSSTGGVKATPTARQWPGQRQFIRDSPTARATYHMISTAAGSSQIAFFCDMHCRIVSSDCGACLLGRRWVAVVHSRFQ